MTATGDAIPIEERNAVEVTHHGGKQLTPHGVGICNPAFDVTPAKYVTAIITERGVLRAPYANNIITNINQNTGELSQLSRSGGFKAFDAGGSSCLAISGSI